MVNCCSTLTEAPLLDENAVVREAVPTGQVPFQ